jgi:hypothetical protein
LESKLNSESLLALLLLPVRELVVALASMAKTMPKERVV